MCKHWAATRHQCSSRVTVCCRQVLRPHSGCGADLVSVGRQPVAAACAADVPRVPPRRRPVAVPYCLVAPSTRALCSTTKAKYWKSVIQVNGCIQCNVLCIRKVQQNVYSAVCTLQTSISIVKLFHKRKSNYRHWSTIVLRANLGDAVRSRDSLVVLIGGSHSIGMRIFPREQCVLPLVSTRIHVIKDCRCKSSHTYEFVTLVEFSVEVILY